MTRGRGFGEYERVLREAIARLWLLVGVGLAFSGLALLAAQAGVWWRTGRWGGSSAVTASPGYAARDYSPGVDGALSRAVEALGPVAVPLLLLAVGTAAAFLARRVERRSATTLLHSPGPRRSPEGPAG